MRQSADINPENIDLELGGKNPEADQGRIQLAVVEGDIDRFSTNFLDSLKVRRFFHTLKQNRASSIAIPTTFGAGYVSFYIGSWAQIPEAYITTAAGFGLGTVGAARIIAKNAESISTPVIFSANSSV